MKTTLSLAAMALAAAFLAMPVNAGALKLDGLTQDSPVQTIAVTKKKKKLLKKRHKKVAKKGSKKKYAKKHGKKKYAKVKKHKKVAKRTKKRTKVTKA